MAEKLYFYHLAQRKCPNDEKKPPAMEPHTTDLYKLSRSDERDHRPSSARLQEWSTHTITNAALPHPHLQS
jgi:hypothetical protein